MTGVCRTICATSARPTLARFSPVRARRTGDQDRDPGLYAASGGSFTRCERLFREERERSDYTVGVRSHQWIDQRSLALHEAVAAKLEAHPQLLDVARRNLERWLQRNPATALREWRRILDSMPLPEVVALLRSSNEEAARLRQSSPFAGLLTTEERRTIMGPYESRRP
jgi:hypothetical protein